MPFGNIIFLNKLQVESICVITWQGYYPCSVLQLRSACNSWGLNRDLSLVPPCDTAPNLAAQYIFLVYIQNAEGLFIYIGKLPGIPLQNSILNLGLTDVFAWFSPMREQLPYILEHLLYLKFTSYFMLENPPFESCESCCHWQKSYKLHTVAEVLLWFWCPPP